MDIEQARYNMIEQQIRPWEVLDSDVLDLLTKIKREDFVPEAYRHLAFADLEIPLKPGEQASQLGQIMLAPKVEARMLQNLQVASHERALEIGTGSGFMAALLGAQAQRVISYEIDDELAERARTNLRRNNILNVEVLTADANQSDLAANGPFDVIVLSGSVAELPQSLLDLLSPGGRLIGIVGDEPMMRVTLVHHAGHGLVTSQPWDTIAPRLLNFPAPERFRF